MYIARISIIKSDLRARLLFLQYCIYFVQNLIFGILKYYYLLINLFSFMKNSMNRKISKLIF